MRLALVGLAAALAVGGCARSAAQVRWDEAFVSASRAEDVAALDGLALDARRAVDAGEAAREAARVLQRRGELRDAAARYRALGRDAVRVVDRARGYYQLARLAEDAGYASAATALYRAIVIVYPELMPGERALAHLLRMAEARGEAAVEAHLRWTRGVYPFLQPTSLGDNLQFQAAEVAARRYRQSGDPRWGDLAETLFRRVIAEHGQSGHWDDAHWELSWLYHARGDHAQEIESIEAIQRRREVVSFFGQNEHPYFYIGQRRIARLYLTVLDDAAKARDAYRAYAEIWTRSIWRDDAWFFAGCAALRLGDTGGAEADFARIAEERPESRFLRRLDLARADPFGPHCVPPEEKR